MATTQDTVRPGLRAIDYTSPFFLPGRAPVPEYHPVPTTATAFQYGAFGALAGLFVSSVQNVQRPHDKGFMGVFTRTGGTIGIFAAIPFVYGFVDGTLQNLRERPSTDGINGAVAGCTAGFLAGLSQRSIARSFGACAFLGGTSAVAEITGNTLGGEGNKDGRKATPEEKLMERELLPAAEEIRRKEIKESLRAVMTK